MTQATAEAEVAKLEALSRERALTDIESWRLQRLLVVLNRYAYSRAQAKLAHKRRAAGRAA